MQGFPKLPPINANGINGKCRIKVRLIKLTQKRTEFRKQINGNTLLWFVIE